MADLSSFEQSEERSHYISNGVVYRGAVLSGNTGESARNEILNRGLDRVSLEGFEERPQARRQGKRRRRHQEVGCLIWYRRAVCREFSLILSWRRLTVSNG